jgi:enoyl-CoA hydratase/carnithine racemase
MAASFTTQVLPSLSSKLGILQLNNPSSLNALTLDMIRCFSPTLDIWQSSSPTGTGGPIRATLMIGSSYENKAGKIKPVFCAGGDVKSIYLNPTSLASTFFQEEYQLNYKIATQPKHIPQVSIWDGVVMGGGVGLSIHGKYRVATENTIFAMPECNIGLYPDVGGSWWIPRLTKLYSNNSNYQVGGVGNYLALTGARLKAEDLIHTGIATHYIKSNQIDELRKCLIAATEIASSDDNNDDCVASVLQSFHQESLEESYLSTNRIDIDYAFHGKDTVEEIYSSLESLGHESKFATTTLATLKTMSPTSLKVTLQGLKRGAKAQSIAEALQMEYRIVLHMMKEGSDFYEGIRAALVDKDGRPNWNPATLADVTDEMVNKHFEMLQEEDELTFK